MSPLFVGRSLSLNLDGAAPRTPRGRSRLVIEILSPGTRSRDRRLKRDLYERAGVREYWLVDPETDVVEVYRRQGSAFAPPERYAGDAVATTTLLPGLEISLASIFP